LGSEARKIGSSESEFRGGSEARKMNYFSWTGAQARNLQLGGNSEKNVGNSEKNVGNSENSFFHDKTEFEFEFES
jgi:hypothetical protein